MRDVIVASDELIASAGYLADRISVNLEQENKIFEEQGVEAYEAYQVAHENENLQKRKGVYPLMKHFPWWDQQDRSARSKNGYNKNL